MLQQIINFQGVTMKQNRIALTKSNPVQWRHAEKIARRKKDHIEDLYKKAHKLLTSRAAA